MTPVNSLFLMRTKYAEKTKWGYYRIYWFIRTITSLLYFHEVVEWEDKLGTMKSVYFIPPLGTKLKWKNAREYCQKYASKDGQKSDLAIGFTSEEIDFLLDQDSYRASWRPHIGIERKNSKSKNMVTVPFGKNQESWPVNADMNWDHWKKPALEYHHQKHFTCLDLDTTKRFECGAKSRQFFCARYWRYNGEKYDKLKSRKGYFQFTDEFSLSAEYHVINKTLDFDEARNYCLQHFGEAFDLAVGFNLAEMQALTKSAKENGFLSPVDFYLGSYRGPQRFVYYSVQLDIPFAAPWASFEPEKRTKNENYGCLSSLYQSRGDCKDSAEPFICSIYLKAPPKYGSTGNVTIDWKNVKPLDYSKRKRRATATNLRQINTQKQFANRNQPDAVIYNEGCYDTVFNSLLRFILVTGMLLFVLSVLSVVIFTATVIILTDKNINELYKEQLHEMPFVTDTSKN